MKENAIKAYHHHVSMVENPTGVDGLERENVRKNAIKAKEDMEEHFKTAPKYRNDPEIQELIGNKPKEKEDGIKPKGRDKRA